MPSPAASFAWEQHRAHRVTYAHAKVNHDYGDQHEYTAATGWRLDDHAINLSAEAPGTPAPDGPFAAAQDVLRRYAFQPPNLIAGYFDPSQPLGKRVMVLRAIFLVFNFYSGVQVADVVDAESQDGPDGPERVWGHGCSTLEGHFERGQTNFSVHKSLTTVTVQFCIHAALQPGHIRNPFYYLIFKLFEWMLQHRFAYESLARLRGLVVEALMQPQHFGAPIS